MLLFCVRKNGLIVVWKEFALYYIMLISAKTKIYFSCLKNISNTFPTYKSLNINHKTIRDTESLKLTNCISCQNLVLCLRILIPMHHVVLILITRSKGPKCKCDSQKTWKRDGPDGIWDVQRDLSWEISSLYLFCSIYFCPKSWR